MIENLDTARTTANIELVKLLKSVDCQLLKTGYKSVTRTYYYCSCDPDQREPICEECSKVCHSGHTIVSSYETNATCQCGIRCHKLFSNATIDNRYEQKCFFSEWNYKGQTLYYYSDEYSKNKICLFCYNHCYRSNDASYQHKHLKKIYNNNNEQFICDCNHPNHLDIKKIFKLLNELQDKDTSFNYPFNPTQFLNIIFKSEKSFENVFSSFIINISKLKEEMQNQSFEFDSNIAYSSFMLSLNNFNILVTLSKNFSYFDEKIENLLEFDFVFKFMTKKFDYKSMNIWTLKKNLFNLYYKCVVQKEFEKFSKFKIDDFNNLNPLQRLLIISNVQSHENKITFKFSQSNLHLLEQTITLIERLNNIREKNLVVYEILRRCYQICKQFAKFNLFDQSQILKFCLLNDEVISNLNNHNEIGKGQSLLEQYQLKMLISLTKSMSYLIYNFNDSVLREYIKDNISLDKTEFFHSKSDAGKIINKNCINVLNFVRSLKSIGHEILIKKIITHSTNITNLSISYPDTYLVGLRKIFDRSKLQYFNYIQNIFSYREKHFLAKVDKEVLILQNKYYAYFNFDINNTEIQDKVVESIKEVFSFLNLSTYKYDYNQVNKIEFDNDLMIETNNNNEVEYLINKQATNKKVTLFTKRRTAPEKQNNEAVLSFDYDVKTLINRTFYFYSVIESLNIILSYGIFNNNKIKSYNILNDSYKEEVLRFIYFFIDDHLDNCILVFNSHFLNIFKLLDPSQIEPFLGIVIRALYICKRNNSEICSNKQILRAMKIIINKISDNPEYFHLFGILLKALKFLTEIPNLYEETINEKLRKILKNLFSKNPILNEYKLLLTSARSFFSIHNLILNSNNEAVKKAKTNDDNLNINNGYNNTLNNYNLTEVFNVFLQFLKLINYLFDGNSTLNEKDFLETLLKGDELPLILTKNDLDLNLRVNLLVYFRMLYIDVIIDTSKINQYRSLLVNSLELPEDRGLLEDGLSYKLFHDLLNINSEITHLSLESSIIKHELKFFNHVIVDSGTKNSKTILEYFENGIILPLYVFLNKFMSIIYDLKGFEYLKLYEIVVYFLKLKKFLMTRRDIIDNKKDFEFKSIFKTFLALKKNKFSLISNRFEEREIIELDNDLIEMSEPHFEILNYKKVYSYYEKHISGFVTKPKMKSLKDLFDKKNETYNDEKINKMSLKYKNLGLIKTVQDKKIFDLILKYENEKSKFNESSFVINLGEQNLSQDSNYRNLILQNVFFLINDERFSSKYQKSSFWNLFKLLQYDTTATQHEIQNLSNIHDENYHTLDFPFIVNIFLENFLSLIFSSCNPSQTAMHEDYFISITIVKILKYLCEEHNRNFQNIFFEKLKFDYKPFYVNNTALTKNSKISLFDMMLGILSKIVILAKWEKVKFTTDEKSNSYFYDIFFVIVELLIEMVQGTEEKNLINIIKNEKEKSENENIGLLAFLSSVKNVLLRDKNDSLTVYKVRNDIINFVVAFLEESSTPDRLIFMVSSVYNPFTIFETIVNTMKKLYIKSKNKLNKMNIKEYKKYLFDSKMCDYFIEKYFNDLEFSKTPEFEFSNRMYQYVRLLATEYNNEDALKIINSINAFKEGSLVSYFSKKIKNKVDIDNINDVIVDENIFQNYFTVKFFEKITRSVTVSMNKEVRVLFTLNPLIPYLSNASKHEFFEYVNRETRYTKLFSLIEACDYFYEEIMYNSQRKGNYPLRLFNKMNYKYIEIFVFFLTFVNNTVLLATWDLSEIPSGDISTIGFISILAYIQLIVNCFSFLVWFLSKFPLYYLIEIKKHAVSYKKEVDNLSIWTKIKVALINCIILKQEVIAFIWNIILVAIAVTNDSYVFLYSIQLLIVVNLSVTLKNIIKAVTLRYQQLLSALVFILIMLYVFSVLAFFFLSKDFVKTIHEVKFN